MTWARLPGWASAAPTELEVAVRARLEHPAAVGSHARHARLDLSGLNLDRLPTGAEPALANCGARMACARELDASGNALGGALALAAGPLASLTALSLAGNELDAAAVHRASLPAGLRSLDLSTNRIVALSPRVLALDGLVRLELARNRLTRLPQHIAAALPRLEALDLSHNCFAAAGSLEFGHRCVFGHLRLLRLRANRLESFELGSRELPVLLTLDLAANRLVRPTERLCSLGTLGALDLSSNQIVSLAAPTLARNRRAWVPPGLHDLAALHSLSLAQNRLVDLPPQLADPTCLGSLRDLDLRCNPLGADAQALLSRMAAPPGADAAAAETDGDDAAGALPRPAVRVRASVAVRLAAGLLLGDPSVAWDARTLRALGVTHVVRVAAAAELGAATHARALRADAPRVADAVRELGLAAAPGALLEAAAVRAAYLERARALHPDRLSRAAGASEVASAAAAFVRARAAYELICEAARAEAVELPTLDGFAYHTVPIALEPPQGAAADDGDAADDDGAGAGGGDVARAAEAEAIGRALDEANRFIHAARQAPAGTAVVLVHAASGWARAAAVVAAYLAASEGEALEASMRAAEAAAPAARSARGDAPWGLAALPRTLRRALVAFDAECRAQRRRVLVHVDPDANVSVTVAGAGAPPTGASRGAAAAPAATRRPTFAERDAGVRKLRSVAEARPAEAADDDGIGFSLN
jgi:hypothetical protein